MNGAQLLTATLRSANVDTVFALSGNQIMPIFDACLDSGIRLVHTRHEAAAVFMADAYAQLTGEIGVALVTAGPGFLNALGPLYMSRMSESPVLLLSGDSPVGQDGRGAFQALDQTACAMPVVKHSARAISATDVGSAVAASIVTALEGRPGPVHLGLAFDALIAPADVPVPPPVSFVPALAAGEASDINALVALLGSALRPLILTGPRLNATRAPGLAERLSQAVDAPVICLESPRGLNDPSLGRFAETLAASDLIVSLGKRIDFSVGFGAEPAIAAGATAALVDVDADAISLGTRAFGSRLRTTIVAEPRAFAEALIASVAGEAGECEGTGDPGEGSGEGFGGSGTPGRVEWRTRTKASIDTPPVLPSPKVEMPTEAAITPVALFDGVARLLARVREPVLVVDGGEIGQWAQASLRAPARVINGPSGAIGGALCHALGAKAARPDATVVAVMGDGAAGFHLPELETASRLGLPFIAVIGDDARWNAEYQIQARDYGPDRVHATTLGDARYDVVAQGLGCFGALVSDPAALDDALERALVSGKPACLVAKVDGWPAPAFR